VLYFPASYGGVPAELQSGALRSDTEALPNDGNHTRRAKLSLLLHVADMMNVVNWRQENNFNGPDVSTQHAT